MKNLQTINFYAQIWALILFSHVLNAQFSGGISDGSEKSSVIQITLNGNQINPLGLYRGGNGDGQDKNLVFTTLAGGEITSLYHGGYNDGNSKITFQGTLSGADVANLFLGGIGDGNDKMNFHGTLDGTILEGLYSGGIGDGNNKLLFTNYLNEEEIAPLYYGGIGDGNNKDNFQGTLDGALLEGLYAGGTGDGNNKMFHSNYLNEEEIAPLYYGGIGDGFSKHIIQYIFDFPGCTFVVNTADDGFGSLRYAINCASPGDTIDFSPLLIQDSIILTSETLEIPEDIFVNADKLADLFVDATQVPRAFNILADFTVTIKGLKIIVGSEAIGGGAQNDGFLTLIDVDIYDPTNSSTSVISNTLSGVLTIQGLVRVLEN